MASAKECEATRYERNRLVPLLTENHGGTDIEFLVWEAKNSPDGRSIAKS